MKRRGVLAAAMTTGLVAPCAGAGAVVAQPLRPDAPPLVLEHTAVHTFVDRDSGRRYPVWVDAPPRRADDAAPRPVVVAADAPWSFSALRSVRQLVGRRGRNIRDFVLVGLAPDEGSTHAAYRARDYTPTDPRQRPQAPGDDYESPAYGGAAAYLGFLQGQVLPALAAHYQLDARQRVFIGHSYGALLGITALLNEPQAFSHYILGSPSLWFDQRSAFEMERRLARDRRDLTAQVRLFAGGYETPGPTPRHYKSNDLVGDMQAFTRQLKARHYTGLQIQADVIADEDHFTVFPSLAARGLTWALPGHGPYLSG